MLNVNENFCKLPETYLFSEIARRINIIKDADSTRDIIRMGIGDVTLPICSAVVSAMQKAVLDVSNKDTFHGYGPEQGYNFLSYKISESDYKSRGININVDEIFISDGAKSDTGNIGDILAVNNKIAITDPVYPVYVDTNIMAGRAGELGSDGRWSNLIYLPCTAQNGFVPELPNEVPDVIYLCYPNNPTGTTLNKTQLKKWVDYAIKNKSIILFDSAYEAFISDNDVPHSIYEIEGAKTCAIEFRSYSKTAGFTGLRCGYTVIPKELYGYTSNGEQISINKLWNRRQCTKFNGASYIIQRGAEAIYSPEGQSQVRDSILYYMNNAKILKKGVEEIGLEAYGGVNAPYIWIKTPNNLSSWDFFNKLLEECNIVGTPGVGFGPSGEGYFRLTAFSSYENTCEAVERLKLLNLNV